MNKQKLMTYYFVIVTVLLLASWGFIGYKIGHELKEYNADTPLILSLLYSYLIFFISIIVTIFLHELGHLLLGLATGYKFLYFRVLSTALVKYDDGYRIKKQYLPGTAGQCILNPPDMVDGKFPFILYNLGGLIMNTLLVAVCIVALFIFKNPWILAAVRTFLVFNIYIILTNGVPMLGNDASNLKAMLMSDEARLKFWHSMRYETLKINDNPKVENYKFPKSNGEKIFSQFFDVAEIERLIYNDKKEEALVKIDEYLNSNTLILPPYRAAALQEKAYIKTYFNRTDEELKVFDIKGLKSYYKGTINDPSRARFNIMYNKLVENEPKKLEKAIKKFEKDANRYIDRYIVRNERKLVNEFINR